MKAIALILIDPSQGRLGQPAQLGEALAGRSVLQHTVTRAARIKGIDEIILAVRDADTDEPALPCEVPPGVKHRTLAWSLTPEEQAHADAIAAARQWSRTCWRGGVAGMSTYDELLPAGPLGRIMAQRDADVAVVVRGDWCCFDPELATDQLKVHRSAPESLRLVFTQAPPGLSALVVDRVVVDDLAQHRSTIAQLLCYNPRKPALDPISRDVCVAVPAEVRDRHRRFIYDTPRTQSHLRAIAQRLGSAFEDADASTLTDASLRIDREDPAAQYDHLPPHLTVELTPHRPATGRITPQHHLNLQRKPMDTPSAIALMQQLGQHTSSAVLLGGLGDALMHDGWLDIVHAARDAGVHGIGLETDLLCDGDTLAKLQSAPVDVLSVRINADTAAVYEKLMGRDGFKTVMDNLQALLTGGGRFSRGPEQRAWIVPRLVKVADNLKDMETFFERWTQIAGWAVIDRFETGQRLIADQGPVPMQPPRPPGYRPPAERHKQRLTVLSDGRVTLCAQDWLGRAALGNIEATPLHEIWHNAAHTAAGVLDQAPEDRPICPRCQDWLAVQLQTAALASA
ncbi:MAG: SPASM domain-containing protein [Phycisphaerales bacterium JB063]